jgi:hypothetical protein
MGIEAHSADQVNPYASARGTFESLVKELSSPTAHCLSHSALEGLIQARGMEVMRQLLQGHLDQRGPGEALESVENAAAVILTHQRWDRGRHWESVFGSVFISRVGYGAKDESMLYPLDGDLNLPQESYSLGVRRRVAQEVWRGSFDEAVAAVQATTGAHVPKRQAEELAVRAAEDFDAFYSTAETVEGGSPGPILALSVDGKGVVMRKEDLREATRKVAEERRNKLFSKLSKGEKKGSKRMATVAAVYTIEPYVRTPEQVVAQIMQRLRLEAPKRPRPEGKRVWASLEKEPEDVVAEAFAEALRRDPDKKKHWVGLVDGNETQLTLLKKYAKKHSVKLTITVDLMHVLSYIWKAAHVFHEEGSKESEAWVSERLLEVLRGRAGYVAGGIRRSATLRGLDEETRGPIDKCADYLLNHTAFLRYDAALAQGLPICTGVIEGTCRHLINDRMDRTGARWGLKGAEAVLRLRSLHASHDFEDYWQFHERQERYRNHTTRYAHGIPAIRRPVASTGRRRGLEIVK